MFEKNARLHQRKTKRWTVALAAVAANPGEDGDDKVCGLVLLSGAGRPAGVVLREQLAALPEPLKAEAYAVVEELEAGRTVAGSSITSPESCRA